MKRIVYCKYALMLITGLILLIGCTDLEETPLDRLSASQFNSNEEQVGATVRGVVASFDNVFDWNSQYAMGELPTDVGISPTRNGGWNGQGQRDLHLHTWTAPQRFSDRNYTRVSNAIGTANAALEFIDQDRFPSPYAEVLFLRALAYYLMIDLYGNVPIVTEAAQDPANLAGNRPIEQQRGKVFNFIEEELINAIEDLPSKAEVPESHYPRPTKEAGQALLAKLYLNAEVWSGQQRWDDCIRLCNEVIQSGLFSLTPSIQDSFVPENQHSPEIIYAKVMTALASNGSEGLRQSFLQLQRELAWKFKLPFSGVGGFSFLEDHYLTYDDDDFRKTLLLFGPQFLDDGTPLYRGASSDGNGDPSNGQFEIFPIEDIFEAPTEQGIKSIKYAPDVNQIGREANNDVVILRYADMLLSKAEAILRGGTDPMGESAADLLNRVRARNFDPEKPILNPTLDDILNERAWEFCAEGHRRQDLIRFGRFTTLNYKFKENFDAFRELYPIPLEEVDRNPNLDQNPGY